MTFSLIFLGLVKCFTILFCIYDSLFLEVEFSVKIESWGTCFRGAQTKDTKSLSLSSLLGLGVDPISLYTAIILLASNLGAIGIFLFRGGPSTVHPLPKETGPLFMSKLIFSLSCLIGGH
jgi:hypothetical protein